MARLVRGLLVAAGVVAVLWAMRDRFVTVGQQAGQGPMSFRVSPPDHTPPPPALTSIPGIGPVYAERLAAVGIVDGHELASARPEAVAEATGVSVTRAIDWVASAGDA